MTSVSVTVGDRTHVLQLDPPTVETLVATVGEVFDFDASAFVLKYLGEAQIKILNFE